MVTLQVNGKEHELDVPDDMRCCGPYVMSWASLARSSVAASSLCGACTVHLDGRAIRSCITPVGSVAGKPITTIEAIGETSSGKKIEQAWLNIEVVQCGYCQSGQIMSAAALIESNPNLSDAEIDAAMSGNICRCGTYPRIRAAIKQASKSPDASRGRIAMGLQRRLDQAELDAKAGGVSRRTFLVTSAAAGGGLLVGFALPRFIDVKAATPAGDNFAPMPSYASALTTASLLVMPQVEMGQGTYTSMSMLIAEELRGRARASDR